MGEWHLQATGETGFEKKRPEANLFVVARSL